MKIIFMGTSQFAVPALKALIESENDVIAVFTNPPEEAGRGYNITKTPINITAEEYGIEVFAPPKLTDPAIIKQITDLKADIICVAAYGKLLPLSVISAAKYQAINIHPSKLPRWRGAAPLQRAIMAGDKMTSVCIIKMTEELDAGDILAEEELEIGEKTFSELHDLTAEIGARLLLEVIEKIKEDGVVSISQQGEMTYAGKVTSEDLLIDWNKDARLVACQIRGLSPRPGAYFIYDNQKIKIIMANYSYEDSADSGVKPGTVLDDNLTIKCAKGVLIPTLLQREGRKMIYKEAFLRGFNIPQGVVL